MSNFITNIKESGTKPEYSEQLNNNIQITNIFIFVYIVLVVILVFFFKSSSKAALIVSSPILVHLSSFFLIRFNKHIAGRLLFSLTGAAATYIIAVLLYNENVSDGMGAKFLIFGSIILPFIVFSSKERAYSVVVILFQLILIFSFNYVNDIFEMKIVEENFDTPAFRMMAIFMAFFMIVSTFFYYQQLITDKNKKLEEKNKLIHDQNDELITSEEELRQNNEELLTLNEHVEYQKNEIQEKHKFITAGINYAKRIQDAMLPAIEIFENNFSNHFIINLPRDIVSGDFYWAEKIDNRIYYAVADCTGHGVPGAMVSMLGISLLNRIATSSTKLEAAQMLDELRFAVKKSLKQTDISKEESKDGLDIALCIIDVETKQLQFSGAYNSLYIYRNDELLTLKADRQPIGSYIQEKPFTNQKIQLNTDDVIYSFSDGFVDQFNSKKEKYQSSKFKKLLIEIGKKPLKEQEQIIFKEFIDWKGSHKQLDDIIVMGLKI
jgi:serine phosphatase RsbU (regulator of sigma subunit)